MEPTENQKKKLLSGAFLTHFPKTHLAMVSTLVGVLCLFLLLLPSEEAGSTPQPVELWSLELELGESTLPAPLPAPADTDSTHGEASAEPAQELADAEPEADLTVKTFTVRSGDSLSVLFQRAGLRDRDLYELMAHSEEAKGLRRIMPGHEFSFHLDDKGQLQQLDYVPSRLSSLHFVREDGRFKSVAAQREPEIQLAFSQGRIESSLFLAGSRAGLPDALTMELANIFGWDIDFALDIRSGDSFSLIYEERYLDGEKIGNGPILAAEFVNRGNRYRAVRYMDREGFANYYTPDGDSMRRAFLRTPVDFTRISSHFNLNRRHPVLHTIRAHRGTDYAAPTGTPIRAAGDGRVVHAGRHGGYGITVIIQHGQTYQTLYAHMNGIARGVRNGTRVRQGQVIGYVGATGLATGPHLHYEFLVNGVHRNPVTVDLPKAEPIAREELERFRQQTRTYIAQLDQHIQATQLASVESTRDRDLN